MPGHHDASTEVVERRSIDYIPAAERRGKPWHCTTVWFMCSSNVTVLALGTIGPLSGLSLKWTIVAIVAGTLFGTFFAAFHSSQGPELGLPQMIQSRAQFGYRGAILIYLVAIFAYLGTSVLAVNLMGTTANLLFGIPASVGMIGCVVVAIAGAAFGYDMIHKWSRYSTALLLIVFGVMTVLVLRLLPAAPSVPPSPSGFLIGPFMLQFIALASGTLSWAPYVSDYTRYLPKEGGIFRSFLATYWGMSLAAIWITGMAAAVASLFPTLDIISAFRVAGDEVFSGFGSTVLVVASIGTILLVAMNLYGAALSALSVAGSVSKVPPKTSHRIIYTAVFGLICIPGAIAAEGDFQAVLGLFFSILLYALAPWTAINLYDFFFLRRGHYSIREIFNPSGIYGMWNWRGYAAYAAAVVVMYPFMTTSAFSGPIGGALGYDIAPFIGIIVAATTYGVLNRNLDVSAERETIAAADAGIDDDRATVESEPTRT